MTNETMFFLAFVAAVSIFFSFCHLSEKKRVERHLRLVKRD